MNHCFKTAQCLRLPVCLSSRCSLPEWTLMHKNHLCAAPAECHPKSYTVPKHRQFGSLSIAVPSTQPELLLPVAVPPHQLASQLQQLSDQLLQLEAVHQLQTSADSGQLCTAALSDVEIQAFQQVATQMKLETTVMNADTRGTLKQDLSVGDPPPSSAGCSGDQRKGIETGDRPSISQLRHVEANLLQNLPKLFVKTQDFHIYHKDMVFDNRIRGTKTVGVIPYIKQCALLRIVGHIKFSYVAMEVLQSSVQVEEGTVQIRWRIRGIGALRSMLMFWRINVFKMKRTIADEGVSWYDGFSTFQVGSDGLIHVHTADKVMPDKNAQEERRAAPALGGLAAVVYGLLPEAAASEALAQPLATLADVGQLATLAARLEQLERRIDTALPLDIAQFQGAATNS